MVKDPANAGDAGLTPGWETKLTCWEQLLMPHPESPYAALEHRLQERLNTVK